MRDADDATDGPPDPQLDPTRSPGFNDDIESIEDIEVGREDVTIGDATPSELTAADTAPVADDGVSDLLETLADGDAADRRRAALALSDREASEQVTTALAGAVRDDPDPDVRQFAVEALGELSADCLSDVARDALTDENPWVRAEAVVVLDSHGRQAHSDLIEDCLEDDHHAVRRNAIVSLAKHREEDLLETLLQFVEDDSERVREWVAEFLGGIDDERARDGLNALTGDDSDIVAEAAANALDSDAERRELFTESTVPTDTSRLDTPPSL
ncbi:MAG: HEAT repeat domain-containing protein [Halapricum sp.]